MFELAIAAGLIVLNGVFALSELALVSSRRARLAAFAEEGRAGAVRALELSADPGRFLSTVQIGITLVGILAGAFSGATLGRQLAEILTEAGVAPDLAGTLGFGIVVALVTYFSLVIGELVPKRIALRDPEAIACLVAAPMTWLSRLAAPLVWLLDASSRAVFALLRLRDEEGPSVSEEEIHALVREAEGAGVIVAHERRLISGVFRFGDSRARALMTPRTEVDWLPVDLSGAALRARLVEADHSRLPVCERGLDAVVGVVAVKDLISALAESDDVRLADHVRPAPVVPETMTGLDLLEVLRAAEVPMALVHDEYGDFEGLVTPADVLAAIAGAFRSDLDEAEEPDAYQRDDGSWMIAGAMPIAALAETLGLRLGAERGYETAAGFVLARLGHIPKPGEVFHAEGWRFEIVDLDGLRIDRIEARRIAAPGRGGTP